MSGRIKVVGYAQKTFFGNGIEYRNFSPDLVGVQLASNGGTPLFTMGNFSITTNIDPKSDKTFVTNKFSNFISLTSLDLTFQKTLELLLDNAGVILNLDKTNLNNYALFGSFSEFVRVSLEDIIIKWPASLYITPIAKSTTSLSTLTGYTFENYIYDALTDTATFKINTNVINNKFQINFLTNGTIIDTFNATNDLRNLTVNYNSYVVLNNETEFSILDFTAATTDTNDYIYFKVKGDAFNGQPSNSTIFYHIKPSKLHEEQFFNALPDFESYLLNRQVTPIYTAVFKFPIKSDDGVLLYVTDSVTWPVTDGYNIDFDTTDYISYATKLLDISNDTDLYSSNLMTRFLVTESISDFDTTPVHLDSLDEDTSGQKMNKTLKIYGREFDDINNFISGIAFANTVTYNKSDNTPDVYLKNLARVLGWELTSSILENDLLKSYVTTAPSTYSGQSVGLTAVEADVELWRRIILNTPWLWKSKGARKSIEFLLKFIGAPNGLISFNEYIYLADKPIDVELFKKVLSLNGLDTDLSIYPIDDFGYPRPLPNTTDMYFQNNGLWYRETGGTGSTLDILTGNNPHLGPYDGGYKYLNQFRALIPNFSAVTVSSETVSINVANLFTNYNLGTMNSYSGDTFVDVESSDGSDLSNCFVVTTEIITDPKPHLDTTDCGCVTSDIDYALSICVDVNEANVNQLEIQCNSNVFSIVDNLEAGIFNFQLYQYNEDGSIYLDSSGNPVLMSTNYTSQICCNLFGGSPLLYNEVDDEGTLVNTGYICCDNTGNCGCTYACQWLMKPTIFYYPAPIPPDNDKGDPYLDFTTQDSGSSLVTPDGCNCIANYTVAVPNIIDPYTGVVGYGCRLTTLGVNDLTLGTSGVMYNTYLQRNNGTLPCNGVYQPTGTTGTTVTTATGVIVTLPSSGGPILSTSGLTATGSAVGLTSTPSSSPTFSTSFGVPMSVVGFGSSTPVATFSIKTGILSCHGGVCDAYGPFGGPGIFKTVYVPFGQTPATAPTIYTDSAMTVILTYAYFVYSGIVYHNIGGHGTSFCTVGHSC